jgi:ABC-2 type transport system permease protein
MSEIFKKTLKEKYKFIIILCVILIFALWLYISLYPTFSKQSGEYEKLLSQFPKEMWQIFGISEGKFIITNLESFISVEMFSIFWPVVAIIIIVNLGTAMIGGEEDKGTLILLLSLPVTRIRLFLGKYLASLCLIALFCFASVYSVIPYASLYNIEYNLEVYHKVFLTALAFCTCGLTIAALCSVLWEKGKASGAATGIYLIMYIIYIVSALKDELKDLRYLSFFHYLDLPGVLSNNRLDGQGIFVFLAVTAVTLTATLWIFNKKDYSS